jgi:hypothetical protein
MFIFNLASLSQCRNTHSITIAEDMKTTKLGSSIVTF